jgi:hypothetical protein
VSVPCWLIKKYLKFRVPFSPLDGFWYRSKAYCPSYWAIFYGKLLFIMYSRYTECPI